MLHHAYRFASQSAAAAALASAPASAEIDQIGTAYAPSSTGSDGEITPGPALPGWFINAIWREAEPASWASARIEPTEAPRWWSGVPRVVLPAPPALYEYQAAIEAHVESTAQTRSYSGAVSCAGYVNSTVPAWAAEAATFVAWRDAVWVAVFDRMAEVQGGAPPPSIADLIAGLPVIGWPA